jgi:hypothetical protein
MQDTFTRANGSIISGAGEIGATWTQHPLTGASCTIVSNRLRGPGSAAFNYASGLPGGPDYDVYGTLEFFTDNNLNAIGVAGRMSTTVATMYLAWWNCVTNNYELYKVVTGTFTLLGSFAGTPAPSEVMLRMRGDQISLLVDDVVRVGPVTDTAITGAGRAGVRASGAAGDAIGVHLQNIEAIDPISLTTTVETLWVPVGPDAQLEWQADDVVSMDAEILGYELA